MSTPTAELIIARTSVVADGADPDYAQHIQCGRHALLADERPARGGADAGPAPFEYLLAALGACTSITLRMYAQRKGWDLGTVSVRLDLRRRDDVNTIARQVTLSGALTDKQRAALADVCERTPVTLAIKAGTAI